MSAKRPLSAEQIVESILKSPKYRAIAPDAVRRIVGEEFARTGGDCEKRARNRLHQVADAFMNQAQQHALWALMERRDVMGALAQHASTRERLANVDEYLALIARHALKGELICDAACGLNPLLLGNAGYDVLGLDIQLTCVDVINAWARLEGWRVSARGADLVGCEALPECGLTLMLKLLPVMDAQRTGESMRLLMAARSPRVLVSFPTRTLGGRGVGMERNYSERFESGLPDVYEISERAVIGTELFYALRRRGGIA